MWSEGLDGPCVKHRYLRIEGSRCSWGTETPLVVVGIGSAVVAEARWVEVGPERLQRWLDGFAERHGGIQTTESHEYGAQVTATDGSTADVHLAFPPVRGDLIEHATTQRVVGVVLVRLGGYAIGVFDDTKLIASKCGTRLVHGRHKAGGQSQQRFARRRENQARQAVQAATDTAARILPKHRLDAIVYGGDKRAIADVQTDPRLRALDSLVTDRVLTVAEPRLKVLQETPAAFRAARIQITET